jgi:hypothetical protein
MEISADLIEAHKLNLAATSGPAVRMAFEGPGLLDSANVEIVEARPLAIKVRRVNF